MEILWRCLTKCTVHKVYVQKKVPPLPPVSFWWLVRHRTRQAVWVYITNHWLSSLFVHTTARQSCFLQGKSQVFVFLTIKNSSIVKVRCYYIRINLKTLKTYWKKTSTVVIRKGRRSDFLRFWTKIFCSEDFLNLKPHILIRFMYCIYVPLAYVICVYYRRPVFSFGRLYF